MPIPKISPARFASRLRPLGARTSARALSAAFVAATLAISGPLWAQEEPKVDQRYRVPITKPPPPVPEKRDGKKKPMDLERMRKQLTNRFPGLDSVDFVRILISSEKRTGACRTIVSPPWETELDVDYVIQGEEKASASGYVELRDLGWWPIYRAPEGTGIERKAPFTEIDLTLVATIHCLCGVPGNMVESAKDVHVRYRWTKGQMPEVSASLVKDDQRQGIPPAIVYGHLLTYEFDAGGPFPEGRAGRCGALVRLSTMQTPPIL